MFGVAVGERGGIIIFILIAVACGEAKQGRDEVCS
jgi:hypothetical protein